MMEYLSERFNPSPLFAWLCLAFLVLTPVATYFAHRPRRRPTVRFSSFRLLPDRSASFAARFRFLPAALRAMALLALLLALARPQAGGEYHDTREGIAIQMLMDVSGSMAEQDFVLEGRPARRIDAVKTVFKDFVLGTKSLRGRENDLIGMTAFAMFAETTCPLTLDHGSLLDLLDETDIPGWVKGRQVRELQEAGFTSLGEAIVVATDDLRRASEQAVAGVPGAEAAKSRVVVLLTDGKDNPPKNPAAPAPDPVQAAKVAATLGIKIYTIGAGGSQPPQSQGFGMLFQRRAEFDDEMLKEIAKAGGGKYFRATDVRSLTEIYEEIGKLETRRTGERTFRDDILAARYAMICGLGLLITELVLVNTRYRRVP